MPHTPWQYVWMGGPADVIDEDSHLVSTTSSPKSLHGIPLPLEGRQLPLCGQASTPCLTCLITSYQPAVPHTANVLKSFHHGLTTILVYCIELIAYNETDISFISMSFSL